MLADNAMDLSGITLRTDGRRTGFYINGEYVTALGQNHSNRFGSDPDRVGAWSGSGSPVNTFYDFDAIAKANNIRYGLSYTNFDNLIDSFDISRLPDYDGMTMPLVGHIIFTRPSLYTTGSNVAALQNNSMTATWVSDRYGQKLLNMLSEFSTSAYMPLFTTRAMSYQVGDIALKTIEKGETYYGHMIKYGHHTEDHKIGNSITIDFRNDRYLSVLRAIYIWMAYIAIVSKSASIRPSDTSQKNGILDYCGSIYYLVTQMDMTRLVYWEKLTGVFPKSVPLGSIFSYSDAPIVEDKLSIEFDYGMRSDPCDPNILMDLNVLSAPGGSYMQAANYMLAGLDGQVTQNWTSDRNMYFRSQIQRPDSWERPFGLGNALARGPIFKAERNTDGTTSYFMQWRR